MKVSRINLQLAGLKVLKWGVKTPAIVIVHGRVSEERRRKAMRRTSTKMKIRNEQQQHKNLTGGFPKQVTSLGVFDFLKNDYRSIINITLISSIVFHMVSTSTFNKDNG